MFVTARKVSCLAQDYVCVLCENNEVNEDISDEYAESEDSTMMILMKVMQNTDVK